MPDAPKLRRQSAAASARIESYIEATAPFAQPILLHLRGIVHEAVPDVEEAVKWSMPFFLYDGLILANMAAFRAHASFRIWEQHVESGAKTSGGLHGEHLAVFDRLISVSDLPSPAVLTTTLREAARKIQRGERTKNWEGRAKRRGPEVDIPEALQAALSKDSAAAVQFAAMSPSCRREYADWVAEAKRDATRQRRVLEAMALIGQGKGRNWKYEPKA